MTKKSLYDDTAWQEISGRIDGLTADSMPEWGSMSVGQMLAHCAEVAEVANGKDLKGTPIFIKWMGPLIKRMILSEKPFPSNGKTHPQYIVTSPREFAAEKQRLLNALQQMRSQRSERVRHPLLGEMTKDERGWAQYKHLDHHLKQFGV